MSPLYIALERYMGMRRTLGFKLSSQEQILRPWRRSHPD